MGNRHVLAALGAGIAANDDDVARAALRRADPIARGFARRRLEAALIDSALACGPAAPPAHVMKLAALRVAGRPVEGTSDAQVAQAYAQLPATAMPRFPLMTVVTLLALLASAGGVVLFVMTRPGPPPRSYVRPLPPPSAEAYLAGGTPFRVPGVGKLLGEALTGRFVAANRAGANDREKLFAPLRSPAALATRTELTSAWNAMLAALDEAVTVAQTRGPQGRDYDDIREAVRDLSQALLAAGLGYHLEGRFRAGYPIIQAYRVEQVVLVTTSGAPRRVLSIRRLDHLNRWEWVLGWAGGECGAPSLHLGRVAVKVAGFVLPVLAGGQPYPLADQEWMLWPDHKQIASAVGDAVRAEYVAALGADATAAQKIAALLVKRGEIIDEWRDKLGRKDFYFISTDELFVPERLLESLGDRVPNYQRNKVREIDEQLAALGAPRIHARINDLVAATVRRHEAQHAFDYDRDTELRYPAVLQQMTGSPHDSDGNPRAIVASARAELSGYLSQILNDTATPQASLWHLGRQVFNKDRWGTGEFYAGLVVLEGLAKQLGADTSTPRYARGLDRDRLGAFATLIAKQPADKLRAAAAALWTDLYGEPPTTIVETQPGTKLAQK